MNLYSNSKAIITELISQAIAYVMNSNHIRCPREVVKYKRQSEFSSLFTFLSLCYN